MPFIVPIVGAVGAALGAVGTFIASSAILSTIVSAGIGIAATYLLSSLMPKPASTEDSVASGVKFQREYGSNISRQVACGLIGMAGHDVYVNTFDESNKRLQQVYVISDYYTTQLSRVAINGSWQSLSAIDPNGYYTITSGDFAGLIFVKFVDGRQTNAESRLVTSSNPAGRWVVDNVGYGVSYFLVEMVYDQEKNSSFPDFFFEFYGAPFYDPRKDSTVGGSGSHRWNDKATHEYTENPIVIEYNYRRGLTVSGDFFCGMDMPASDLPLIKWFAAMNLCDEYVNGAPRYRISIILDCMSQHLNNLQSIATSCGALQIDAIDGSWPLVGSDQPPVMTFTDDDIISLKDFRYQAKRSMSELINSVSGNFPYPDQLWSMIGYVPQVASDYVTIDRRTRDVSIDYPMVPYHDQATRLAWIALYENRYEIKSTVCLRPRFQVLEAGDWVVWNSARYGTNTFIVTGVQLLSLDADAPRCPILSLQQRDGQIYEGVAPPPIVVPTPPGEPVYLQEVESFDVIAVSVVGDSGRAQAALRASWLPITDTTVTGVELRWFPQDQVASVMSKIVDRNVSLATLVEGVVGNTNYVVQARLLTSPARTTVFNAGKTVKTLDIVIDLGAAITYQVTTLLTAFDARISEWDQLISSVASNQNGRNWLDKQMNQRQMMSVTGTLKASITEVMTVATDTQQALADYSLVVDAQIADVSASVTTNATAIANVNGKLLASYQLTLNVNGYISGVKAYNDGSTSVFAIQADAFFIGFPGYGQKQAFAIQNVNGVAQAALKGDFIADGSVRAQSILTASLTAISANFGTATVTGYISGPTGRMISDYNNERMVWSD